MINSRSSVLLDFHPAVVSTRHSPPSSLRLANELDPYHIHLSEMAKSDSKKRAEMMAKEWKKSKSTTKSSNELVEMGHQHNQELGGWRAPSGESFPDPRPSEIVVFEDFFKRGSGF